jgi:hypothetical protein
MVRKNNASAKMNRRKLFTFLALFGVTNVRARVSAASQTTTTNEHGEHFVWKGVVMEIPVSIEIQSSKFEANQHEIDLKLARVDGYPCLNCLGPENANIHIQSMKVTWGDKILNIKKGVYSSVFEPLLNASKDAAPGDEFPLDVVLVFPSDTTESIFMTMPCGGSAQTFLVGFYINKNDIVDRFTLRHVL